MKRTRTQNNTAGERSLEKTRRAGLYARVSTTEQSADMQIEALREEAERRGWKVIDEYVDEGVSGAKERRAELDRLMNDVRSGKVDLVAVWRFDRFARSTRHLLSALDEFRELAVDFVSLTEAIQTDSPLGEALFTVMAAIGQLELSLIRERVQEGIRRARKHRTSWGRPQRWTDEQVQQARQLRQQGKSWRQVAMAIHLPVRTIRRAIKTVAKRGRAGNANPRRRG